MIRILRIAVIHLLYSLGVLQLLVRITLRRRAVVLTYHRVLSPDAMRKTWSHPGIIVSAQTFERHMRVLRRYFHILSPEGFSACLKRGRFEPRSCLVTFDDGWVDTYTEAWPLMRRYGVPALVFLPSRYIGTRQRFWQEGLSHLLHAIWCQARIDKGFSLKAQKALSTFGLETVLDLKEDNVRDGILGVVQRRKAVGHPAPDAPLDALRPLAPGDPSDDVDTFIGWEQVLEMAQDGITFGAHGETHRRLTTLPVDEAQREIKASREMLERTLGDRVTLFSYPNGDWNAGVAHKVAKERFSMAFSTGPGWIDSKSNRFALSRINVHEDMTHTTPMFLARLIGIV